MAWLRLASPLLLLLLAAPAAAQSALGSSSLGGPSPSLPQPVPPGGAHVLRAPPGMVPQRPASPPAAAPARPAQNLQPPPASPPAGSRPAQRQAAEPRRAPPAAPPPRAAAGAPTQPAPQTPVKQRPRSGGTAAAAAGAAAAGTAAAGAAAEAAPPASPAPTPRELESPDVGSVTGLPLPRFVSLRSDEVNMRIGPDTRFPIEWTYQRRDLPVQILREYNHWRRIRDMDGTEGWVHQSTLAGRRTFLVRGPQEHVLRAGEGDASGVVARLMPGVVGRIRSCRGGGTWCEVQVSDYRGYLKRSEIWGVTADEEVN